MKTQLLKSLVIVAIFATITGSALGQRYSGSFKPACNPVNPNPNPGPIDPIGESYFLGVYTSKVLVNAYGGGQPTPNPGFGPLANRSGGRVAVRVVPGAGQDVYGMRINQVVPNSPAQFAGLEPGDIILDANGYPMDSRNDLHYAINSSQGVLEMKVLDGRTGRLMWVVAQTQTQNVSPMLANRVRTQRHQATMKTRSANGQQPKTQPTRQFQPAPPAPVQSLLSNGLSTTLRRAPIRRGQR